MPRRFRYTIDKVMAHRRKVIRAQRGRAVDGWMRKKTIRTQSIQKCLVGVAWHSKLMRKTHKE